MPDNQTTSAEPISEAVRIVAQDTAEQIANARRGRISVYTCPECGGSLWQVDTPVLIQFRCHVGHVLSGEDLIFEQAQAIEASLWRAVRLSDDRKALALQMGNEARGRGLTDLAERMEREARHAEQQSRRIQQFVEAETTPSETDAGLAP